MWKDSETELDFLDFDYLINMLKDIIEDQTLLPSSVGVYGDWGSGKSSLISMSMNAFAKDKDTICLVFNGWLFEGYEDAKTALMGSILDKIQEKRKLSKKAAICISSLYKSVDKLKLLKNGLKFGADIFLTGGIGTIADITLNSIASKIKDKADDIETTEIISTIKDELNNKEIRDDIKKFQKNFANLLNETKIKRLVVFIDELDRCSTDTILETLEAIRLFLFTGNAVFIIGADERHISYAVRKKFEKIEGLQIDIGKEYLEKIVQYPIRIPRLNTKEVEFYITCLLFQKELNEEEFKTIIQFLKEQKNKNFLNFSLEYTMIHDSLPEIAKKIKNSLLVSKQLSSVLANGLNGNPRHCKRFLNSLVMRERMAQYKGVTLDRKVLAKVMLLEYFKSPLFRKIAQIQATEQGKPQDLKLLESGELKETSELKLWKDDRWVLDWCDIDPKLGGMDLRPYFYFSRAALDEKFDTSVAKLSPKAKEVLDKLISKTALGLKDALKAADEINEYESGEILQNIFAKIISETSIDNELFKAFIEWGKTKEILYSSVISNLSGISGERMKLPLLPAIKDFMKQSKKKTEISELAKRWGIENSKLKPGLEREFENQEE